MLVSKKSIGEVRSFITMFLRRCFLELRFFATTQEFKVSALN